jgi:hypothetical protein
MNADKRVPAVSRCGAVIAARTPPGRRYDAPKCGRPKCAVTRVEWSS